MTTSPARFESSHADGWRFTHGTTQNAGHHGTQNGRHVASHNRGQETPSAGSDWPDRYTQALVARVAAACDGQKPTPLAARLKLHPETVRRYLNGQRPSPEFLAAICSEMGVSAAWLLLGEGDMYRPGKS